MKNAVAIPPKNPKRIEKDSIRASTVQKVLWSLPVGAAAVRVARASNLPRAQLLFNIQLLYNVSSQRSTIHRSSIISIKQYIC